MSLKPPVVGPAALVHKAVYSGNRGPYAGKVGAPVLPDILASVIQAVIVLASEHLVGESVPINVYQSQDTFRFAPAVHIVSTSSKRFYRGIESKSNRQCASHIPTVGENPAKGRSSYLHRYDSLGGILVIAGGYGHSVAKHFTDVRFIVIFESVGDQVGR